VGWIHSVELQFLIGFKAKLMIYLAVPLTLLFCKIIKQFVLVLTTKDNVILMKVYKEISIV